MNEMTTRRAVFLSATEYAMEHFAACYVEKLVEEGYEVRVICGEEIGNYEPPTNVEKISVEMLRKPSPFRDLRSLYLSYRLIKQFQPEVVYTISPKGGLIGQAAAFFAGVGSRTHFFTGQVWKTREGFQRKLLKFIDKIIGKTCTSALVDSKSQKNFLVKEGVLSADKGHVLGSGSVSGIDSSSYLFSSENKRVIRHRYGFSEDQFVVLFLARVSPVKGGTDLIKAFSRIADRCPDMRLLMVGPDEGDVCNIENLIQQAELDEKIVTDWNRTVRPAPHYSAADLFCLPSYMEGFGNVILEAACAGVPTVGSDIYGIQDAIVDGETGELFTVGEVDELAAILSKLYDDRGHLEALGKRAKCRVETEFSKDFLMQEFTFFHKKQLSTN